MPSPNKLIIRTLVGTLQRKIDPEKLYDALDRMAKDLSSVYDVVFDGPLEAVDGFNLTRLNAAVLEGELPPGMGVAYLDELNEFSRGQSIVWNDVEEPFLEFGFGDQTQVPPVDPNSYFRILSVADDEFSITQNIFWDDNAGNWERDDGALGALSLEFIDGDINFLWYDSVLPAFRNTFNISGKVISAMDDADAVLLSIIELDAFDVIRVGEDAATDNTPVGHFAIPAKASAQLPATGDINASGIIIIDKTNNRLCFYHGTVRYYVAGTLF